MTTGHLLGDNDNYNGVETTNGGCTAVPSEVVNKLQSADNTVESSRVRTFETFIQSSTKGWCMDQLRLPMANTLQAIWAKRRGVVRTIPMGDGLSPSKKQKEDVDMFILLR
jgi:hypothetical protein